MDALTKRLYFSVNVANKVNNIALFVPQTRAIFHLFINAISMNGEFCEREHPGDAFFSATYFYVSGISNNVIRCSRNAIMLQLQHYKWCYSSLLIVSWFVFT